MTEPSWSWLSTAAFGGPLVPEVKKYHAASPAQTLRSVRGPLGRVYSLTESRSDESSSHSVCRSCPTTVLTAVTWEAVDVWAIMSTGSQTLAIEAMSVSCRRLLTGAKTAPMRQVAYIACTNSG